MVSVLSPPPLFPPPLPPPPPSLRPILYYALVVVATAALSLALYNIVILKWCSEQQQHHRRHHSRSQSPIDDHPIASNFRLISSFKFKKEMDQKVRDHEQGYEPPECSICLSVFEEDDELKRLPRCMHCFHTKCIDKWLISQFNCPLCRLEVVESTDGRRSKEANQLPGNSHVVIILPV